MITDSVKEICDSYIEFYIVKFVDNLLSQWSNEGINEEGLKNALEFLYKVISYDEEHLDEFFENIKKQNPDFTKENPNFKQTIECSQVLSRLCNGNYEKNPAMFEQCQQVSNMDKQELSKVMGKYFRDEAIGHLKESYPNRFVIIEKNIEKYYQGIKQVVIDPISSRNLSNSIC